MKLCSNSSTVGGGANLLAPERTVLVIVDHQVAFESCFEFKAIGEIEKGLVELVLSAEKTAIPIVISLIKSNG